MIAALAVSPQNRPLTYSYSTTGGTSDARFIHHHCPVVEFGLVGETMHKVDENVAVADVLALTEIYRGVLERFFTRPRP